LSDHIGQRKRALGWGAISLLIILLAAASYSPVRRFGFVRLDDPQNVSEEPHVAGGFSASSLRWALSGFTMGHWVPLTRLTYLIDQRYFGLDPRAMHVENVALHAAGGVLLFLLLADATGAAGRSAVVGALFVVHPMHVESVAWITERRDVLSTPLLLGAIWAYVGYCRARQRGVRQGLYCVSLALLAASLLAKAMGVTVPALLLLLDAWPLHRLPARGAPGWGRVLLEKVPFALLAAPVAVLAVAAQASAGAAQSLAELSISDRLANGVVTAVLYAAKLVAPVRLSVIYVRPLDGWPVWQVIVAGALTVAAGWVVRYRRRWPYLAFGVAWFAISLLPVSGLVQSGPQAMADRYSYVPSIGLLVAAVWAAAEAIGAALRSEATARRVGGVAAAVCGLCIACRVQVGYWRDTWTLFRHASDVTSDNWFADYHLGVLAFHEHDLAAASDYFGKSLLINPNWSDAWNGLGICEMHVDARKAIPLFETALGDNPKNSAAWVNLGYARQQIGQPAAAAEAFDRALQLEPALSTNADLTLARQQLLSGRAMPAGPAPQGLSGS
jgi:tetratricopeptide (TPR) repeat protein